MPKPSAAATQSADHPLDHDGDGRPGGVAPVPDVQHLVALKDDADLGFVAGEVLAVSDAGARDLLKADAARVATVVEIELAQPRIRHLTDTAT